MSRNVRYWSFVGLLAAGVGVAVATTAAQGTPPSRGAEERVAGRDMMVLDSAGSRLGVMVQDLDPTDKASGVRVHSVNQGSPAEKAGVKAGDIVVEYDGERVRSARQFTRLVKESPAGRPVALAVMRDGGRQSLTATPEARALTFNLSIDGDRIRQDVERSLEGFHGFRMDMPPMNFRYENAFPPSSRRRLGVSVDSLSDQLAQYFGAAEGGALITSVEKGSAAEKAGLKAGDVITSINGDRVRDAEQVRSALRAVREGEISIGYMRDRKPDTAKATIQPPAERPNAAPEPRRPVRPAAFTAS